MAAPVIHHLDCGTMCPHATEALGLVPRGGGHLVAHCLLVEGDDGLVLVDTGYGTGDVENPRRLGAARHTLRARLDRSQTAVEQVRALGHDPADVRHILVTHLDLDHAGGLGDFPYAAVHLHRVERAHAEHPKGKATLRYRTAHWAHGARWVEHEPAGEAWFGFEQARLVDGVGAEIAMIPLAGHTHGHSGYALRTGDGWLLHCGDAYLNHGEIATPPEASFALRGYHRLNSEDEGRRRANVARLAELAREHRDDVTLFCSHDPTDLARLRAGG